MYICQEYQEQELQTASFAVKSLGRSKTLKLKKGQDIKSIAQKTAGVKEQQFTQVVSTVVNKSKATSHGLRSSVIWNAVIMAIKSVEAKIQAHGRVMRQDIQLFINISLLLMASQRNVNSVARQNLLTGLTRLANTYEIGQIVYNYAGVATFTMMGLTKHSDDTNSVIRKRYATFTSPDNQLPDNWQDLTPEIQGNITG